MNKNMVGYSRREKSSAYRLAIAGPDQLAVMAAPAGVEVLAGGALLIATQYTWSVAGGTNLSVGSPSANGTLLTAGANSSITITVPQQAGADYYDVFLATGANPLWVGRVTESQRAAAGCEITAVGVVDNLGANAAGTISLMVVGTGLAKNIAPFSATVGALSVLGVPVLQTDFYDQLLLSIRIASVLFKGATSGLVPSVIVLGWQDVLADWFPLTMSADLRSSSLALQATVSGTVANPFRTSCSVRLFGSSKVVVLVSDWVIPANQVVSLDIYADLM